MKRDTLSRKKIFLLSRFFWGMDSQLDKAAEESAELAAAILRLKFRARMATPLLRRRTIAGLISEIADVRFLLDELEFYLKNERMGIYDFPQVLALMQIKKHKKVSDLLNSEIDNAENLAKGVKK